MSGFLHRLAARTLGLAPQVRPRAALPYAAAQADFPGAEPLGRQPADPASPDTFSGRSRLHQEHLPDPLVARAPAATGAASRLPAHPLRASETMRPIAPSATSQPDEGFATEHSRPHPETEGPVGDAGAQNHFGDLDTVVSHLLRLGKNDTQKTAPTDLVPANLAAPAGVATVRRERLLNRPSAAASDAAPEVHITIGRLEVNPPSRPPPPSPSPPRGPAPLSLSDYLARRNGGRP